ncbi:hypothetical protein ACFCXT_38535, partial [Streptomyces vinaceus]
MWLIQRAGVPVSGAASGDLLESDVIVSWGPGSVASAHDPYDTRVRLRVTAWCQQALRALLATLILVLLVWAPHPPLAALLVAAAYWLTSVAIMFPALSGERSARPLTAWGDLAVLTAVTLVGPSPRAHGPGEVLVQGGAYAVVLLLATFKLGHGHTATLSVVAVALFLVINMAGPVSSGSDFQILLQTGFLTLTGLACTMLSSIQQYRVERLARLAADRSHLVAQAADTTERQRRAISETLHDGALQTVLVAIQDIQEAYLVHDPEALERTEHALRDTVTQLRQVVTELHPYLLEHGGVAQALRKAEAQPRAHGGLGKNQNQHEKTPKQ